MKKSLLLILASLFAIFALTGCAEDSKNDTPAPTPGSVPSELAGTYNVTFFGSQVTNAKSDNPVFATTADALYISNDCVKAAELYPDVIGVNNKNNCGVDTQSTLLDGQVVISVVNGNMTITSRMQMEGGAVDLSEADKYQYTIYNVASTTSGTGVTGWNYDVANNAPSAAATDFPNSPFTVTQLEDGSVRIDMTLVDKSVNAFGMQGIVDAKNTIILTKVNDTVVTLENKIQKPFTTNTPVDLTKPETLNGNYEVTFFGSQVINPRNADNDLALNYADLAYISNDCTKAAELYPDIINQGFKNQCTAENQAQLLDGKVLISIVDNKMNITSRMQLYSDFMEKMSPADMYQYTQYYETTDITNYKGTGVKGWNYDSVNNTPSATATEFPESPYSISLLEDGSIRIDMTLVGKTVTTMVGALTVDAKNTIILKKVDDTTDALENTIQAVFPTPAN